MPRVRLTRKWVQIASAGECIHVTNIGLMPVILSTADRLLEPGGVALHADLPGHLAACAARGVTEIAMTITPGLMLEDAVVQHAPTSVSGPQAPAAGERQDRTSPPRGPAGRPTP